MLVNKYPGKCKSCNISLKKGSGFAYKNGHSWFQVCASTACQKRLGLNNSEPELTKERKITEDGIIFMPFDREALPLLKSLPKAKWNPDLKHWSCSVQPEHLPRVLEIAKKLELNIPDSLVTKAIQGTEESRAAIERAKTITRHDGCKLFPFQIEGVEFLALHKRALLGDDMGLGKTPMTLVALPKNRSVILICPASLKYNWNDEISSWRPDYKTIICKGKDSFVIPEPGEVCIINYDILPKWLSPTKVIGKTKQGKDFKGADLTPEQKEKLSKTIVIADECQLVKNYKAERSKRIGELTKIADVVWFLTGTPLLNRATDLYGILQSGNMNIFSWDRFVKLFDGYKNPYGGYEFGLPSPETAERLKQVMLRRHKSEVLKDLPPKTYQNIKVDSIGKDLQRILDNFVLDSAIKSNLIKKSEKKETLNNNDKFNELAEMAAVTASMPGFNEFSKIRAELAKSRIPAMLEVIETYEESNVPLIVFSAYQAPIKALSEREGWKYITGDTDAKMRRNIVNEFQNGLLKGVALTIKTGGVGLTLTRAHHALFIDLDWTPGMNIQAEDRICRIGQKSNKVIIMRMSSNHPLDNHIQKLIEYKIELAYKALDDSIKFNPIKHNTNNIELIEETEEELQNRIKLAEELAIKEYSLSKIASIASREIAKVNDIPEPELTINRKVMLRKALEYLSSKCDGAISKDGEGFNRPDSIIGHWLNGTGLSDEDDLSFRVLERILIRYRKQLSGKFEEIWKPNL